MKKGGWVPVPTSDQDRSAFPGTAELAPSRQAAVSGVSPRKARSHESPAFTLTAPPSTIPSTPNIPLSPGPAQSPVFSTRSRPTPAFSGRRSLPSHPPIPTGQAQTRKEPPGRELLLSARKVPGRVRPPARARGSGAMDGDSVSREARQPVVSSVGSKAQLSLSRPRTARPWPGFSRRNQEPSLTLHAPRAPRVGAVGPPDPRNQEEGAGGRARGGWRPRDCGRHSATYRQQERRRHVPAPCPKVSGQMFSATLIQVPATQAD